MNKFIKVLNDVHDFIVGRTEKQPEKSKIGFSTEKFQNVNTHVERKLQNLRGKLSNGIR